MNMSSMKSLHEMFGNPNTAAAKPKAQAKPKANQLMTVTPRLAKQWLRNDRTPGKLVNSRVQEIAQLMRKGIYRAKSPIKFSGELLKDGKHRLRAIVASGATVPLYVVGLSTKAPAPKAIAVNPTPKVQAKPKAKAQTKPKAKAQAKRSSKPPAPKAIAKLHAAFQGVEATRADRLEVSHLAPKHLAKLGRLIELRLGDGRILKPTGVQITADARGRIWFAGKRFAKPNKSLGADQISIITPIKDVIYVTQKVHLGDKDKKSYIHLMGEDGGRAPSFAVDRQGFPVVHGGSYTIEARGIVR